MNRRELIATTATVLAGGLLPQTLAHAASSEKKKVAAPAGTNRALIDAALECLAVGQICQTHCRNLMAEGDQSVAECAKTVAETITLCGALVELAAQKSERLPKFAAICLEACKACEKACRVHEKHHVECRNCAESCAKCVAECLKIAA